MIRTRTLHANTLPAAMKLVREVCGADAVIVNTHHHGTKVSIEVAVDGAPRPPIASEQQQQWSSRDVSSMDYESDDTQDSHQDSHGEYRREPQREYRREPQRTLRSTTNQKTHPEHSTTGHSITANRSITEHSTNNPASKTHRGLAALVDRFAQQTPHHDPTDEKTLKSRPISLSPAAPSHQLNGRVQKGDESISLKSQPSLRSSSSAVNEQQFSQAMASVLSAGVTLPNGQNPSSSDLALGSSLSAVSMILKRHKIPQESQKRIITKGQNHTQGIHLGTTSAIHILRSALSETCNFANLLRSSREEFPRESRTQQQTVAIIGPPGSGKTACCIKLASRAMLQGLHVSIVDTDTARLGAYLQLSQYTEKLGINLCRATDGNGVMRSVSSNNDSDLILIDTAGINPFNPEELAGLLDLCSLSNMTVALAMDVGRDPEDCAELMSAFAPIRPQATIFTKIDLSRRLGCLFATPHIALCEASWSPKIESGLHTLTPHVLSQLLVAGINDHSTLTSKVAAA